MSGLKHRGSGQGCEVSEDGDHAPECIPAGRASVLASLGVQLLIEWANDPRAAANGGEVHAVADRMSRILCEFGLAEKDGTHFELTEVGRALLELTEETMREPCGATCQVQKREGEKVERTQRPQCEVYRGPCPVHGFVHGVEAQELRVGIEDLIKMRLSRTYEGVSIAQLQTLISRVEARDSLAFFEEQDG